MAIETEAKYSVGGVFFDQPFKIRRLGHFGINAYRMSEALRFYNDLLGFRITDVRPMGGKTPDAFKDFGDTNGYFFRYGGDHHAFVLYNHRLRKATDRTGFHKDDVTINQITWQVGSLAEVVEGDAWFKREGQKVVRSGRDMPGSNWHSYLMDPDLHKNEIYYGMEQVGWDGRSKPWDMHDREFDHAAELPQISEYEEVNQAMARGSDLVSGFRDKENLPLKYDVQGILLARPFKIVKHGPVNLFVENIERAVDWYQRRARLHRDGGNKLRRRALRFPAQQHRASFARPLPGGAAPEAGLARRHHDGGVRRAAWLVPAASQRDRLPQILRRRIPRIAAGDDTRHGSYDLRPRSRRPCDPALLVDGADRLGRQTAPRCRAPQDRPRQMAEGPRGECR